MLRSQFKALSGLFSLLTLLALPAQSAPSTAPSSAGKDTKSEPVRIETSDSQVLFGDFFAPKGVTGKAQAVLLLHAPDADRSSMLGLAEALQKKKLAVLTLDLRGHGESSDAQHQWQDLSLEERSTLWTFALRDVEAAAKWLHARTEVHSTAMSVVGVGASAALAAHYSISDPGVRSLLMVEPFVEETYGFNLQRSLKELEGMPIRAVIKTDQLKSAEAELVDLEVQDIVQLHPIKCEEGELLAQVRFLRALGDWIAEPSGQPQSIQSSR